MSEDIFDEDFELDDAELEELDDEEFDELEDLLLEDMNNDDLDSQVGANTNKLAPRRNGEGLFVLQVRTRQEYTFFVASKMHSHMLLYCNWLRNSHLALLYSFHN